MKKVYENVEKYDFIAEVESEGEFAIEFEGGFLNINGVTLSNGKHHISGSCILYGDSITSIKFDPNNKKSAITSVHIEQNYLQTHASEMFRSLNKMHTFTVGEVCFVNVVDIDYAWSGCTSLTDFPYIDTSNVTSMNGTWRYCKSLQTFPLIYTNKVVDMRYTWHGCESFTTFPYIDTGKVVNMCDAWKDCKGLLSFPLIDIGLTITDASGAWRGCINLKATPLVLGLIKKHRILASKYILELETPTEVDKCNNAN